MFLKRVCHIPKQALMKIVVHIIKMHIVQEDIDLNKVRINVICKKWANIKLIVLKLLKKR